MTGKTGYTALDNNDEFGFDQINTALQHFDALIDPTVSTASSLPASGNWVDRTITAQDTGRMYRWNGSAWVVVGGPGLGTRNERTAGVYASNAIVGLLTVTLTNAPAGQYLLGFNISIDNTQATRGEFRVTVNSTLQFGPIPADHAAAGRLSVGWSDLYTHTGGDLVVTFSDFRTAGSPTVQAESSGFARFVGPA